MAFSIKICGVTNASDAAAAIELGADAIGLNFYAKSLRSITPVKASVIRTTAPRAIYVGVFVNASVNEINEIASQVQLDYVQLHGDESPEICDQIESKVIRVVRVSNNDFISAQTELELWSGTPVAAILLDAASGQQYGGTGKRLDWSKVNSLNVDVPMILAGGLDCDNVTQAIQVARPHGVDVASGVEKFPGSKDTVLMQKFIQNACKAFESMV